MSAPLRILVVEDHPDIAANIGDYLAARGHVIDFARDGASGHELATRSQYDALIVDLMLPRMDGLTMCRKLRGAGHDTPVVMLTSRDTVEDTIEGFDAGADDYLTKPFSLQELEVRLRALVRRCQPNRASVLRVADLELDTRTRTAQRANQPLELTPGMYKLLVELMRASPHVVPRQRLEVALWGDEPPGDDALRAQIYALRRIVDKPFDRRLVHTVHGTGYRLYDRVEATEACARGSSARSPRSAWCWASRSPSWPG